MFDSWNSFDPFQHAVRYRARFFHTDQVATFLAAVAESTARHCSVISHGKALWRAQLGHDLEEREQDGVIWDEPVPFQPDRMKPRRLNAHEGRVNPRGIPCLYVANKKETAIAEVRPWVGALVSVAQMSNSRPLRIVNCTKGHGEDFDLYFDEPPPDEREQVVWRAIGRAFSAPASPQLGIAEYAPTQVLAEQFKNAGYDGVGYISKLGDGLNIALFDVDIATVVDVRLYPVNGVAYEIGEVQNSYVVKHQKVDESPGSS